MKNSGIHAAILLAAVLSAGGCNMTPTTTARGSSAKTVSTIAGQAGVPGSANSPSYFNLPAGVVVLGGNLYVCDSFNSTIRKYAGGTVTTIPGVPGQTGYFDNSSYSSLSAYFNHPEGIATDGTDLYIADSGNGAVRKLTIATAWSARSPAASTIPWGCASPAPTSISRTPATSRIDRVALPSGPAFVFAGQFGTPGSSDGIGSGAAFTYPQGITTDGTYLYVADTGNGTIRKILIATGAVTTLAGQPGVKGDVDGTGSAAAFDWPEGITIDNTNTYLYVADTLNSVIRQVVISTGVVTTLAGQGGVTGSADGDGNAATFNHPMRLVYSPPNLYVADTYNQTIRLVK